MYYFNLNEDTLKRIIKYNIIKVHNYITKIKNYIKYQYIIYIIFLLFISCNLVNIDIKENIILNETALSIAINSDSTKTGLITKIYSCSFLAIYEIYDIDSKDKISINNQINGFEKIPIPVYDINTVLAGFNAYYTVLQAFQIKSDEINKLQNDINQYYKNKIDNEKFQNSLNYGKMVSKIIINNFYKNDGLNFIKNLDELNINRPENIIKTPTKELLKNSNEIYKANNQLNDLQKNICDYWNGNDSNLNTKINISSHWLRILSQIIKKQDIKPSEILKLYAILGIAMNESYKIGIHNGYKMSYTTPKKFINNNIDANWNPYLKNKELEYNSITSIISSASANIITNNLNINSSFNDSSIYEYIGKTREFSSLVDAAAEASISRAYGGLHYIPTVNLAAEQGKFISKIILNKFK